MPAALAPDRSQQPVVHAAGEGDAYWLFGDLYVNKVTGRDTDGRLAVIDCTIWPGHGSPPHTHAVEDESFYILEGTFNLRIGDETRTVGPGDFAHVPHGLVHCYQNTGSAPGRFIALLTPAGFEQLFAEYGTPAPGSDSTATPPPIDPALLEKFPGIAARYGLTLA